MVWKFLATIIFSSVWSKMENHPIPMSVFFSEYTPPSCTKHGLYFEKSVVFSYILLILLVIFLLNSNLMLNRLYLNKSNYSKIHDILIL